MTGRLVPWESLLVRWALILLLATSCATEDSRSLPEDAGGPSEDGSARALDAGAMDGSVPKNACEASDLDQDGYGTDPSCPEIDCDDNNISIHPGAAEACNNIDEDCDNQIDEDLGEGTCGIGECVRSAPYCMGGQPAACEPGPPMPELCNNLDDDCDGEVDEMLSGMTCGVGACARTSSCSQGAWGTCTPGQPIAELCNREDDDCDGEIDEDFGVEVIHGTYTTLSMGQSTCDGSAERMGLACNEAIHLTCAGQGCSTTGFGPLENSGDVAHYACLVAEPPRDVTWGTLAGHHSVCNGVDERVGPNCNAAIHRYCTSSGMVSGFGPVFNSATGASIVCLDADFATVVQSTYTELEMIHSGCNQSTRYGPACNAAINRYCNNQTAGRTGFGPVENSGDVAVIVCVSE